MEKTYLLTFKGHTRQGFPGNNLAVNITWRCRQASWQRR